MTFRLLILTLTTIALCSSTLAQTPPIKPDTPDIPLPPPVTLPTPPVQDPEIQGTPLTASEAAAIALHRQPSITLAQAAIQAARGTTRQAQAGLGPQIGVTAGVSNSTDFGSGGSAGGTGSGGSFGTGISSNAGVTVSQLLFDFGRTRTTVRQQQALERAAGRDLTRVQQDTVFAVKQAFYTYAANVDLVRVSEQNVTNSQAQLDLANARLDSGLGAPGDLVQAKTSLGTAVLALTAARANASTSRVTLAQLMGVDPRTPINPAPATEPDVAANDVNALVDQAFAARPEIAAAQERIIAARFGLSAARLGNVPTLAVTANAGTRGTSPFDSQSGSIGLTLNLPLFDNGLTAGRVQTAQAGQTTAQANLLAARQQVITDVSQSYVNLRTTEQNFAVAQAQVANAAEYLRIAQGRYQGGIGTFLDVTTAQSALFNAQRNLVTAQQGVQTNRAALSRAIGVR